MEVMFFPRLGSIFFAGHLRSKTAIVARCTKKSSRLIPRVSTWPYLTLKTFSHQRPKYDILDVRKKEALGRESFPRLIPISFPPRPRQWFGQHVLDQPAAFFVFALEFIEGILAPDIFLAGQGVAEGVVSFAGALL